MLSQSRVLVPEVNSQISPKLNLQNKLDKKEEEKNQKLRLSNLNKNSRVIIGKKNSFRQLEIVKLIEQ